MILREYVKGLGCILLAVLLAGFSLIPVYYEISGSRMSASSFKETLTALFIWTAEYGSCRENCVLEPTMKLN